MKIKEVTINGIEYIIETHDDGFICKRVKNTGTAGNTLIEKAKEIIASVKTDELDKTDLGLAVKALLTAQGLI